MTRVVLDTDDATASRMSRQRRRDTAVEVELRSALFALGLRYRVDLPIYGLPRRRADITFTAQKVAVFVDGCFWHACPQHATLPRRNGEWWAQKLERNVQRDRETDEHLRGAGWKAIRVWEHEALEVAVGTVVGALAPGRDGGNHENVRD